MSEGWWVVTAVVGGYRTQNILQPLFYIRIYTVQRTMYLYSFITHCLMVYVYFCTSPWHTPTHTRVWLSSYCDNIEKKKYGQTVDCVTELQRMVIAEICLFLARQSPVGHGLLIHEVFYITHNGAPQSVGLLWTSDQLVAESSTWQLTTFTTAKHPCLPDGIRTHDLSRREAADLRLRPRGHWDRLIAEITVIKRKYE